MALLRGGQTDFFGLDIGTTAIRAVQLNGPGPVKNLGKYGQIEVESNKLISESNLDRQLVSRKIQELVGHMGISSRNVAVNLPSNKVFTAIVDMDRLPEGDLAKTMQYQAESFIPTPLAKSRLDWAVIGNSPKDSHKIEVLLTSAPSEFIETRVNMLETIGLNVIAAEPDSMAIARSLITPDDPAAQMVMDLGSITTDLVVVMNGVPHLTRAIPIGTNAIIKAAMQNLEVSDDQASQFVFKFGLGKDKLEGKVYSAIIGTVETLMSEIEKSVKFFVDRYAGSKIDHLTVTGGAAIIPELPTYMANRVNLNVEIGNSWRNVSVPASQQNELAAVSNHFAVAVGLAERE
jgi:type IV pilus assembly protein PilM